MATHQKSVMSNEAALGEVERHNDGDAPSMRPKVRYTMGPGPGRKSKACLECKRLKMKCEFFPGDYKCTHCLRRGVDCVIKRVALPTSDGELAQNDAPLGYEEKIDTIREELQQIKTSLGVILSRTSFHQLTETEEARLRPTAENILLSVSPNAASLAELSSAHDDNTQMAMTRENSVDPDLESVGGHGPVTLEEPMGTLYEVTKLRNIRSNKAKTARLLPVKENEVNDFITRGVIPEGTAEDLYKIFQNTLNHYLWVGLEQTHPSFNSVRQSSELLTATILTVTALHIPTSDKLFDVCYKEFLFLISSSIFSRYHSIDDVRGLCIAAFWLSEVSWKLSGHAIRIATELNLHKSFTRALEGDKEHFLRARLWYMLYVCDHHFSIAYGRPPMIAESRQIREHERFLASPHAGILDSRILSQVNLMQILTRLYYRFGEGPSSDPDELPPSTNIAGSKWKCGASADLTAANQDDIITAVIPDSDLEILRTFNLEVDQWRIRWFPRQPPSAFIGDFPNKGIILYSYFAKLQINCLAVRGISVYSSRISIERVEFINMAISAGSSILNFVLEEDDIRNALVGTPLYVHTMITFASLFLIKVVTRLDRIAGLHIDYGYVSNLLERMVVALKRAVTSDRHMIQHIAAGLEKMLDKMKASRRTEDDSDVRGGGNNESYFVPQARENPKAGEHLKMKNWNQPDMPPQLISRTSVDQELNAQAQPGSWNTGSLDPQQSTSGQEQNQGFLSEDLTIMDDNMMQQVFGSGSATDLYNMLSTQFL